MSKEIKYGKVEFSFKFNVDTPITEPVKVKKIYIKCKEMCFLFFYREYIKK